jgi:hypothetical protein
MIYLRKLPVFAVAKASASREPEKECTAAEIEATLTTVILHGRVLTMLFKIGDTVKLKASSLQDDQLTPSSFVTQHGFPNRFTISQVEVVLLEDGSSCNAVALTECCGKVKRAGQPLCDSHPEDLFELFQEIFDTQRPTRETIVNTPFGQAFRLSYFKRDGNSGAIRFEPPFGIAPIEIIGPWADLLAERFKRISAL